MRCIDADAMIDEYGEWYAEEGTEEGYIGTIKGIVDSMPTIEPETEEEAYERGYTAGQMAQRKKGNWILGGYDDMFYVCDQCGYQRSDYYAKPKAKYCENCGADMRSEPEDIPMEYFESGGR